MMWGDILKENFELVKELADFPIELKSDTIVRIKYDDVNQTIKEMQFLKIVGMTEKGLRLSNGVLVCKGSLFPYHHKKHYIREEEYYFLENLVI